MKNLRITVNGTAYDVQVEELGGSSAPAAAAPAAPGAAGAAWPPSPAPSAGAPTGPPKARWTSHASSPPLRRFSTILRRPRQSVNPLGKNFLKKSSKKRGNPKRTGYI